MPTFDYACEKCGEVTEVLLVKPTSKPPTACPSCGEEALVRRLSAPKSHARRPAAPTCCGEAAPCATPACMHGSCPR